MLSHRAELDLFIVSCQVPNYQPSNPLWGEKQGDGTGFNFVTYFAIPPAVRKMLNDSSEPPLQAVRLLKNFMAGVGGIVSVQLDRSSSYAGCLSNIAIRTKQC